MNDLDKKIKFAIHLLQSIPQDGEIEVAYSGGKDSDVILQLAKEAGIPYKAIYKNTTIDPKGTVKHAKEMGVEIVKPKMSFFELIRQKGFPTRFYRFCCGVLKEYKILDRTIIGVRRSESRKRAEKYKEPEICRVYSKKEKVKQYFPILEWTDEDVATFIKDRGIKCHPLYYDEDGNFHVERRLGCVGCPLQSVKKRREEFMKNPKMLRLWIANHQKFVETHPDCMTVEHFYGNSYDQMFYNLFLDTKVSDFGRLVGGGLFPELKLDCKQFLEDYFKIDLTPPKFYR